VKVRGKEERKLTKVELTFPQLALPSSSAQRPAPLSGLSTLSNLLMVAPNHQGGAEAGPSNYEKKAKTKLLWPSTIPTLKLFLDPYSDSDDIDRLQNVR